MEDHWVAEYWNSDAHRWVLADAQIDARHREMFGIDFDLADVPRDQFVVAGAAWRQCRTGEDDPNRYGLTAANEFGDWWIAANLMRDVAALSGLELLPWDVWGVMPKPEDEITPPRPVPQDDRLIAVIHSTDVRVSPPIKATQHGLTRVEVGAHGRAQRRDRRPEVRAHLRGGAAIERH